MPLRTYFLILFSLLIQTSTAVSETKQSHFDRILTSAESVFSKEDTSEARDSAQQAFELLELYVNLLQENSNQKPPTILKNLEGLKIVDARFRKLHGPSINNALLLNKGGNISRISNSLIITKGDIDISYAENNVIIATEGVQISHGSQNFILAGRFIDIGHQGNQQSPSNKKPVKPRQGAGISGNLIQIAHTKDLLVLSAPSRLLVSHVNGALTLINSPNPEISHRNDSVEEMHIKSLAYEKREFLKPLQHLTLNLVKRGKGYKAQLDGEAAFRFELKKDITEDGGIVSRQLLGWKPLFFVKNQAILRKNNQYASIDIKIGKGTSTRGYQY